MFVIRLLDPGESRLGVIRAVAEALQIPNAQAKSLVDHSPDRLAVGDAQQIAYVRRRLKEAGATIAVDYWAEGMSPETWVPAEMSHDQVTCSKCGAPLFYAVPGRTTEQEIVAFAEASKSDSFRQVASDKWIHPGVYCPNECCLVMVNLDHPDRYTGELR